MQEQQLNHGVANEPFAMPPQKIEEHMTDGKNDKTTDEARTGPEADKNREELEK